MLQKQSIDPEMDAIIEAMHAGHLLPLRSEESCKGKYHEIPNSICKFHVVRTIWGWYVTLRIVVDYNMEAIPSRALAFTWRSGDLGDFYHDMTEGKLKKMLMDKHCPFPEAAAYIAWWIMDAIRMNKWKKGWNPQGRPPYICPTCNGAGVV